MNCPTVIRMNLDEDVPPGDLRSLGDEPEFAALVADLVAVSAPRLFAVVQEYGTRVDGRVAAWGLAFDDHVDVLDVGGVGRARVHSLERAVSFYARPPEVSTRVVFPPFSPGP